MEEDERILILEARVARLQEKMASMENTIAWLTTFLPPQEQQPQEPEQEEPDYLPWEDPPPEQPIRYRSFWGPPPRRHQRSFWSWLIGWN